MRRLSVPRTVAQSADLPFYCDPLYLFFAVWALMLASFQLHISYNSYPDIWLALALFALSALSFLIGYATSRLAGLSVSASDPRGARYSIDLKRLRCFYLACTAVVLGIMVMNLKLFGLPPIFGFFGVDTLDYQEYGSLRQVMFPAILAIFISAPLEPSWWRRWALYFFSPACLLIYSSRGYLLVMLFQALIVFSLRTRLSKYAIYAVATGTLVAAILLSNLIGNSRNSLGAAALFGYMQIKHAYYDWPAAYVWVISYVSTPISNLCWIVHSYPYRHPSFSFLYSALPGFWAPKSLEIGDLGSEKIVDGVHTYVAKYYLDFWYFGVFGINYVWGLIAGVMKHGDRIRRNYLVSAVLLGCLGFIFFADFLTILIILLEIVALAAAQRYFTVPVPDTTAESGPTLRSAGAR